MLGGKADVKVVDGCGGLEWQCIRFSFALEHR